MVLVLLLHVVVLQWVVVGCGARIEVVADFVEDGVQPLALLLLLQHAADRCRRGLRHGEDERSPLRRRRASSNDVMVAARKLQQDKR